MASCMPQFSAICTTMYRLVDRIRSSGELDW